jgi:hypothetical protein
MSTQLADESITEMMVEDDILDNQEYKDTQSINLDVMDINNDMESLDDFESIDDLDSIDELDSDDEDLEMKLNENLEELSEDETQEQEPQEEVQEQYQINDFQKFLYIQKSLNKFYKDELYKSDFVQKAYIADNSNTTNEFKKYLQDEMLLDVYVRTIDLGIEILNLAKKELGIDV